MAVRAEIWWLLWPESMRERTCSTFEADKGCISNFGALLCEIFQYLCSINVLLFTSVYSKQYHMTCHMMFPFSVQPGGTPINHCNDLGGL